MIHVSQRAIEHPVRTLTVASALTILLGAGTTRLELATDGAALVPSEAPAVQIDREIRARYGLRDPLVVSIRPSNPRGIYSVETIALVDSLTRVLAGVDGVDPSAVVSLATEASDRYRSGTLSFARLLEPMPADETGLTRLRDDLSALDIYTGTLAAPRGEATAIYVGVPDGADRIALAGRIEAAVALCAGEFDGEIDVIGPPVAEATLGTHILSDLRYLVPLAFLVMAIVFALAFRRAGAVALPLIEVAACLLAVLGLMGWVGTPVYLTIAVLPVILTMIGTADEVHVFTRYAQRLAASGREPAAAGAAAGARAALRSLRTRVIGETMREMAAPVAKTSVTTAIGFLSFAISPIVPVRAFGLYMAVGILLCLAWTLTVVPAMIVLWPERSGAGVGRGDSLAYLGRALGTLGSLAIDRPRVVVWVAVGIGVLAALGASRIVVQDSWVTGFGPSSRLRVATERFDRSFHGAHVLLVEADASRPVVEGELDERFVGEHRVSLPPEPVGDPSTLIGRRVRVDRTSAHRRDDQKSPDPWVERHRRGMSWESWIVDAGPLEGRVTAITARRDGSPRFRLRLEPGDLVRYAISTPALLWPVTLARVDSLEAFIAAQHALGVGGVIGPGEYVRTTSYIVGRRRPGARTIPDDPDRIGWLWDRYAVIRGEDARREVLAETNDRGVISVYLRGANYVDTAKLLDAIGTYAGERLRPFGIDVRFGGDVAVSQALIEGIVSTQVRSLALSLAGIFLVTSFLHRSWRWGAISVLPSAAAVLAVFGLMGWAGLPLGVSTSMFAGMTLGVGVDFSIHLVERYRHARRNGLAPREALRDAATVVGPAVSIDAIAVGLGFGVLLLSSVPANARLGALALACVAGAWLGAMLLVPALLTRPGDTSTRDRALLS